MSRKIDLYPAADRLARLSAIGQALYGPRWKAPMARALRMSPQSLHYRTSGRGMVHITELTKAENLLAAHITAERGRWVRTLAALEPGAARTML